MNLREPGAQRMQLRTRLPTLLQLALQSAQDVVKRESALPRDPDVPTHTAHPLQALLQRRPPLRTGGAIRVPLAVPDKVERAVAGPWLVGHGADVALRALLLRLRFGALRGLRVELREDAYDACRDLVVDDRFVVLADDVDTEFLDAGGS